MLPAPNTNQEKFLKRLSNYLWQKCNHNSYRFNILSPSRPLTFTTMTTHHLTGSRSLHKVTRSQKCPSHKLQHIFNMFKKALRWGYSSELRCCLCYCMRRMRNCFVKWLTIRNIVFTSYYLRKKFYLWNFVPLIVYSHCHNVIIRESSSFFAIGLPHPPNDQYQTCVNHIF